MTDIVERLLQVQGDNEDAREAAAEIRRLRAEIELAINCIQKDISALLQLRAEILR
jgi:hypothetical protein